ncbi:protein indeterminate-domain 4 chloroplastic [Phtheirospermum japonicum]|uniref:Protein indeterminate-domain 4 chloroplastic n=1 Tax=Phtheirospermum japonicum TaxID=374723 RepID=A0A830CCB0_9LAMI|nr:protein indeterminate-domain 4 chloroplastic [Phtheirospermum japonicum]
MAAPPSSSSAFRSMRDENEIQLQQQQQLLMSSAPPPPPPPAQPQPPNKKRRNQPGNPNPDAEVIALSPKTLMATNRFVCEVCNKGFQREQNLQLHRRGHNLPWKLRQKSTKEVKRKVYLCPEPTCVHHDPARALGDLTGIKKHYSRKHGEKKYKCEKCSKKYAVQSDWKAHSKTCGTREYRCDCGTLFSRRDSFITHRAFCDALAQESARNLNPPPLGNIGSHLLGLSQSDHHINHHHQPLSNQDLLRLGRPSPQFESLVGPGFRHTPSPRGLPPSSSAAAGLFLHQQVPSHDESQSPHGMLAPNNKSASSSSLHGLMQLPQLQMNNANGSSSSAAGLFNLGFFPGGSNAASDMEGGHHSGGGEDSSNLYSSGNLMSMAIPSLYSTSSNTIQTPTGAHMSATALLQKAAQLGSTTSNNAATSSLFKSLGKSSPSDGHSFGVFEGNNHHHHHHLMHDLVNSMGGGGGGASSASIFGGLYATDQNHDQINDDDYRGFHAINHNHNKISFDDHDHHQPQQNGNNNNNNQSGFMSGLERAGRLTRDFLGVGEIVRNVRDQHNGVEMSTLDHSQGKSSTSQSQSFGGGSF